MPKTRAWPVEHGVDAMVVSNHGGRQLDGARSTISALPEVVDAVAGRCEVLFDGGVRTGQDVLKALALGAKGCLIGKAFLYALAARGEAGVSLALDIIRKELAVSLALTGANDVRNVTRDILVEQPRRLKRDRRRAFLHGGGHRSREGARVQNDTLTPRNTVMPA